MKMSEGELQKAVIELAQTFGWKVLHVRPAQNSSGDWRTPVAADGKGWPDLTLASDYKLAFVELKSATGRVSPEQKEWLEKLSQHTDTMVWRPADWLDGSIEKYLREWAR